MKIFICTNDLPDLIGFRGDFVQHLVNDGHNVTVVLPRMEKEHLENYPLPEGCACKFVYMAPNSMNPIKDMLTFFGYSSIFKLKKPDVVINYTIKPNIYSGIAAKLLGIKVISMVAGLGYMFQGNSTAKNIGRSIYRYALRRADKVIVLNQSNYDIISFNGFAERENMVLFREGEGVDLARYSCEKQSYSGDTIFLMVARLLKDKGYREYVKAAEIIKKKYPNTTFRILGKTAYDSPMGISHQQLEHDVASGVIEYLGFTKNVIKHLKEDVVVVLPSYHEGMSRSLMEACSMGCPIITTDIPGCRNLVDEGVNGYTVPVKNARKLAEKMEQFIILTPEEKLAMANNSRRFAEKHFDIRRVIARYDAIINELTEPNLQE